MITVTYRIDEELKAALDEFCAQHGLKQQAVVSEALAAWLGNQEVFAWIDTSSKNT